MRIIFVLSLKQKKPATKILGGEITGNKATTSASNIIVINSTNCKECVFGINQK